MTLKASPRLSITPECVLDHVSIFLPITVHFTCFCHGQKLSMLPGVSGNSWDCSPCCILVPQSQTFGIVNLSCPSAVPSIVHPSSTPQSDSNCRPEPFPLPRVPRSHPHDLMRLLSDIHGVEGHLAMIILHNRPNLERLKPILKKRGGYDR